MKLSRVSKGNLVADGVVEGDLVRIVGPWQSIATGSFELSRSTVPDIKRAVAASQEVIALSEVKLELPIDARNKIICVGINYRNHVDETLVDAPPQPALFLRHIDSLAGPADPVIAPKASVSFDYEGEIAVVIGKAGRNIAVEQAMEHVLGYSCLMDGSVREFQKHSLSAGKNFWKSGAMGPYVVTIDELGDISKAHLETRVDGEVLQTTTADLMIFDIPQIIAYCSIWTQLNPGDVIATGTPGGVGIFRTPPRWLKAGETVEVTVSGIGTLRNTVVPE